MTAKILIFGAGAVGLGVLAPTLEGLGCQPVFVRRTGAPTASLPQNIRVDSNGFSKLVNFVSVGPEEIIGGNMRIDAIITCVGAHNLPVIAPIIVAACKRTHAKSGRRLPVILLENLPALPKRQILQNSRLSNLEPEQVLRAIYYGVARFTSHERVALIDERPIFLEPTPCAQMDPLGPLMHRNLFELSADFAAEQALKTCAQLFVHDGFNMLAFAAGKAQACDALGSESLSRLMNDAQTYVIQRLGTHQESRARLRVDRTRTLLGLGKFDTVFVNNRDPARKLGVGERFGMPLRWVQAGDETREGRAVLVVAAAALHYGDQIWAAQRGCPITQNSARALQGQPMLDGKGCAPLETQLAGLDGLEPTIRSKLRDAAAEIKSWR